MRFLISGTRKSEAQCPHLGLAEDPFDRGQHASDEHRCYAQLARERIDLAHQRRFCLTAAHGACPFLLVSARAERPALLEQARAGWRNVSLSRPALPADQLGRVAGLVPAAAQLVLQTWCAVRPSPAALLARHEPEVDLSPSPAHAVPEVELPLPVAYTEPEVELSPALAYAEPEVELLPAVVYDEPRIEPAEALLARGIAAINAGADGYPFFKAATKSDRANVAAWFWRAKTAETLDEVIDCLMRANALDPRNDLIADNLAWASARRDASKAAEQAVKAAARRPQPAPNAAAKHYKPSPMKQALSSLGSLLRTGAALVIFALAAAWLLVALPAQIRDHLLRAVGFHNLPLPDVARLTATIHIPLGGEYDAASALPYCIAFFTAFVGIGLLNRERWTRLWVPALILGSAWLIAG